MPFNYAPNSRYYTRIGEVYNMFVWTNLIHQKCVPITTHAIGDLSVNDFILAAKVDQLTASSTAPSLTLFRFRLQYATSMIGEVFRGAGEFAVDHWKPIIVTLGLGVAGVYGYNMVQRGSQPEPSAKPPIEGTGGGDAGDLQILGLGNEVTPPAPGTTPFNGAGIWDCKPIGPNDYPNAFRAALAAGDSQKVEQGPFLVIHKKGDSELSAKLPQLVHSGDQVCVKTNAPQSLKGIYRIEARLKQQRFVTAGVVYRNGRRG